MSMTKHAMPEWRRLINATKYSLMGLKAAFINEAAFRHELLLACILIPLAVYLAQSPVETILLILPIMIVLMVELINSAIEAIVDRIGTEHHELSGRAKDIGSATVFIALISVPAIWGLLLFDHFF